MPGGDRTGPRGEGPGTGRGAGYCGGFDSPGYMNPPPGYGGRRMRGGMYGRGAGRAAGWGRRFMPLRPAAAADELDYLRREADVLERRLRSIEDRIRNLESDSGGDAG